MLPAPSPAPADVAAALNAAQARTTALRLDLRWFPSLTSTMAVASELVDAGGPEGLVVVADEQTHGRGRRGRGWSSPPGAGVYLSMILSPPVEAASGRLLPLLTLAAGVAVREAIVQASGVEPELKWPNDVVVGGRKLAGILAEGVSIGTLAQRVILGVGVNVRRAVHPADVAGRATSIEDLTGQPIERGRLLEELLVALPGAYDDLRRGGADDILRGWRAASPSATGVAVEWDAGGGRGRGVTAGLDDSGALLVRTADGITRVVAGELAWGGPTIGRRRDAAGD